jgi:hypothetical protein
VVPCARRWVANVQGKEVDCSGGMRGVRVWACGEERQPVCSKAWRVHVGGEHEANGGSPHDGACATGKSNA